MMAELPLAAWTDVFAAKALQIEVWRWLALLGVLLLSFVLGKGATFFLQRQADRLQQARRMEVLALLLTGLTGPVRLLALGGGLYLAHAFMFPAAGAEGDPLRGVADFWRNVCKAIAVLAGGWFIYRLVDLVEVFLRRWTSRTDTLLDDQLVPLVRKTLRVFVVIVAALFIAQNVFAWDIGALVAGLGIGGLAFALAAKDMLANLFGSVTIFADRPFHMGDRVRIRGYDGMVEEVGFRSTRVRTLDGHLVTIPNGVVATEPVENVSRRPSLKRVMNVTVTYDTAPEKLQRAVDILREMLDARSGRFPEGCPPRVHFSDFNADSLNIVVYYWFTPPDWWEYLEFNHHFNMELLRRYNDEGIQFAFPTRTLYLKQDAPIDAAVRVLHEGAAP